LTEYSRLAVYGLVVVLIFATAALTLGTTATAGALVMPAGVAAAAALTLAWSVARTSARASERLRDATRSIAAGRLDANPPLSGPPAIAETAAAVRDLAELLRHRTQAVQAADSVFAGLVESLAEAVVVLDASENVVRINGAGRELFALDDPVPFAMDRLPRVQAVHQALRSALGGNSSGPAEIAVRTRQVSLSARPLPDGGAVLTALDLSPVRRLEAVRRDFVANVSHELRTPLTVVRGFAETLAGEDLTADTRREFAETIRANTARMQRIVDDLLDLSRIESGGWIPQPETLEFEAIASEALSLAAPQAGEKHLSLEVEVAPGATTVHADRVALGQILSNLVENAIRHTMSGSVTVFSEAAVDGTWLGVRDSGEGIPREHLPRVFERFYRADPGRSRQSGGTGLGLAIVKHLVEAHGGAVTAESDVGRGTTIRAFFPFAGTS
jgi:two-component system phosphate regulon sensor histidine kinase PhoR